MREAVAAIRRRNTLSAVPLAIQKPAGQANNPAYRRLKCFFVLTKGMSLIGPRPERPVFHDEFCKRIKGWEQRLAVRPGITGLAQVTGGYELLPKEKARFDICRAEPWVSRKRQHVRGLRQQPAARYRSSAMVRIFPKYRRARGRPRSSSALDGKGLCQTRCGKQR